MSVEVPNTARFTFHARAALAVGQVDCRQTWYVKNTVDAWTVARLQAVADVFIARWGAAAFDVLISARCTLDGVEAQDLGTDPYGPTVFRPAAAATTGTDPTAQDVPAFATGVIRLITSASTEPKKSYVDTFPMTELRTDGNSIADLATLALFDGAYTTMAAGGHVNADDKSVLVSRFFGFTLTPFPDGTVRKVPTPRAVGLTNEITDVVARQTLGRRASRQGAP